MTKCVRALAMVLVLMIPAAGCAKNDQQRGRQYLRGVSEEMGNALIPAGSNTQRMAAEGQMLHTLTATLPDGLVPDNSWQRPELVDNTGVRHQMITSWISTSSNGPSVFSATFE